MEVRARRTSRRMEERGMVMVLRKRERSARKIKDTNRKIDERYVGTSGTLLCMHTLLIQEGHSTFTTYIFQFKMKFDMPALGSL